MRLVRDVVDMLLSISSYRREVKGELCYSFLISRVDSSECGIAFGISSNEKDRGHGFIRVYLLVLILSATFV